MATGPRPSLYPNYGNATMLANSTQFLLNGVMQPLPANIAVGSTEMKESYVKIMQTTRRYFFRAQTTPDKLQEFLKNRVQEVLKNSPPDPIIQAIYTITNAATVILIIVVGYNVSARL